VEVIRVRPRAEDSFGEAGGKQVAVQKRECDQPKERRYSDERRMAQRVLNRSQASASEKWRLNKGGVEETNVGVPMLECRSLVHSTYEDGAGDGRRMQVPEIRVRHAQGSDENIICY
jgi:hypothetical protein